MNDKNLSLNLYDYLAYSQNKPVRGVSLITDKQCIFYTQLDNSDITHDEIYTKLENEIHPNDVRDGFKAIRNSNIHIASVGHELVIYLPDNSIIDSMMYHIDLEDSLCLLDIKVSLKRCNKYYNDSYYKGYLLSIFPDFIEVYNLINKFDYDDLLDEVSGVNFNNIKDILLSKLSDYSKKI